MEVGCVDMSLLEVVMVVKEGFLIHFPTFVPSSKLTNSQIPYVQWATVLDLQLQTNSSQS